MMIRLTTVALALLYSAPVEATITYNEPPSSIIDSDEAGSSNSGLRGLRSAPLHQQADAAEEAVTQPQHLLIDEQDAPEANEEEDDEEANYYLRGIRSEDPPPPKPQDEPLHREDELLPPQPQLPLGSEKPKIRHHSPTNPFPTPNSSNPLQKFAQNMLTSQGCPPTATTTCGSICYVLTPDAASDLHSVATGKQSTPTHHWHDPTSFWNTGVCNAKSQCVSVNPFDVSHDFDDLQGVLEGVEKECGRSVGMGTMFVLAKAMEPPAWLKRGKK